MLSFKSVTKHYFISTGIAELDNLLKRHREEEPAGLALPIEGGAASSVLVTKGPLGAGKSVLSAIVAYNLHCRPVIFGDQAVIPFVVYFSYSQPARGLYDYIDDILLDTNPGIGGDGAAPAGNANEIVYPLILSPKKIVPEKVGGGVQVLSHFLTEQLSTLLKSPPGATPWTEDGWRREREGIQERLQVLKDFDTWQQEVDTRRIVPTSLPSLAQTKISRAVIRPVVVVDPINFFFTSSQEESRVSIASLLSELRERMWLVLMTIEDAGEDASEAHRQQMSSVLFEADVVIELAVRATPYTRRTIEVRKNRNSQPVFGTHLYRIEKRGHSLWNVPSKWQDKGHPGCLIFPSIHWFLSQARDRYQCWRRYYSGMAQFDETLRKGQPITEEEKRRLKADNIKPEERPTLPPDSFMVVRGDKGAHKLSIAFNVLVAGLWNRRERELDGEREVVAPTRNVMLLSLGEEINMTFPKIALCRSLHGPSSGQDRNNGYLIEFTDFTEPSQQRKNTSFKLMLREWIARDPSTKTKSPIEPQADPSKPACLVEATFKPGHLSPDEFLWVVERLIKHYNPSRILVENTAHLRMRFPELHHEKMLFPALCSLTQSKQIILIVTDVMGGGSDVELSYGLAASADYVVDVSPVIKEEFPEQQHFKRCVRALAQDLPKDAIPTWSKMTVSNVRGKNYRRVHSGVTVFTVDERNCLFLRDITMYVAPYAQAIPTPRGRGRSLK